MAPSFQSWGCKVCPSLRLTSPYRSQTGRHPPHPSALPTTLPPQRGGAGRGARGARGGRGGGRGRGERGSNSLSRSSSLLLFAPGLGIRRGIGFRLRQVTNYGIGPRPTNRRIKPWVQTTKHTPQSIGLAFRTGGARARPKELPGVLRRVSATGFAKNQPRAIMHGL